MSNVSAAQMTPTTASSISTELFTTANKIIAVTGINNSDTEGAAVDPYMYRPFWIQFIETFPLQPLSYWSRLLFCIGYGLLFCFGFPGNIVSFIVMLTAKMRNFSYTHYLAALAVYDFMSLTAPLMGWINLINVSLDRPIIRFLTPGCKVINFYMYIGNAGSFSTITIVSIERFIAVCVPFAAQRVCKPRVARYVILGQFLMLIAFTVENLFTTSFAEGIGCYYTESANRIHTILAVGIFTIGTSIVVFTLNTVTVIRLLRQRKISSNKSGSRGVQRITVMLMVVSFAFVALLFPTNLLILTGSLNPALAAQLMAYQDLLKFLYIINNVINFYLYIICGRDVRNAAIDLFRCDSANLSGSSSSSKSASHPNNAANTT
ncbi:C5a anaphylatoxin chemotactic receptor 1-like [Tubulanus polymorphus]|uniref:C5a anaphylatoxin chemotactic receptor 1-like n=1 Tax=Tubulanus polymorphus TaxID=672921 RepID=UPI003DA536B7